jgi:hypothetical protein
LVTLRVKITEVESVLLRLPAVFRRESVGADLALHHDHQTIGKNDHVYTSA